MEKSYEQKVNDWLNTEPSERNLEVGATLMLQGNRNRILHQNVLRKENFDKIEYELQKIIGSNRVVEVKIDIPALELKAQEIEPTLEGEPKAGKRADHDSLPEEIKVILAKNLEIYRVMRSLFERIKLLSGEEHTPEERLPFVQELLRMETILTENWAAYDSFDINRQTLNSKSEFVPLTASEVSAARKFLSTNKSKLAKLQVAGSETKAAELLKKMQDRYNSLVLSGETFAADQLEAFAKVGLIVGVPGTTTPNEGCNAGSGA